MKKNFIISLLTSFAYLITLVSYSQSNQSVTRNLTWPYELPSHESMGPMDVQIHMEYYFVREGFGGGYRVNLRYKINKIDFTTRYGTQRFKYQNQIYKQNEVNAGDGLGFQGWEEIKITSIVIGNVTVPNLANNQPFTIESNFTSAVDIGSITKDADLNMLSLMVTNSYATRINWDHSQNLVNRIKNLNQLNANRTKYKTLIQQADAKFNSKSYVDSKNLYQDCLDLFPQETYPQTQIQKIDNILAKQSQTPNNSNTSNSNNITSGTNTSSTSGSNNNSTNNSPLNTTSTTNSSTESSPISERVMVNGEYVKVYKQGGKFYMIHDDGRTHETSEQAYNTVNEIANRNKANQSNSDNGTSGSNTNNTNTTYTPNNYMEEVQKSHKKIEEDGKLLANSFYAAQAVSNAKNNLQNSATLDGNYTSVEQLEADFYSKYNSLNQNIETVKEAKNASLQANYEYIYKDGSETDKAIGQLAVTIGTMVNEAEAEKERKRMQAELEAQRQEQKKQLEEMKRQMMIEMRKKLLSQFREGGVPLSSHNVEQNELYFFAYRFDQNYIQENTPLIYVTNVFPIGKYGDGTWPFKSTITNEITKLGGTGTLTLVGYYTTQSLAEEMRNSFVNLSGKSEMKVLDLNYKGKKTSTSANNTSTEDFWGNTPVKKDTPVTNTQNNNTNKSSQKTEDDFWETGTKQKTTPTTTQPKTNPVQKKSNDDFWNE